MEPAVVQKGHPKGLYLLFFTEMWERFSYYGMRAILILFMTKAMQFDSKFASGIYGNFTAVVYLTPLIGGFISDRFWGNRRSILVGGITMAIGQFLLFICASFVVSNPDMAKVFFVLGLTALVIGNGFFKPNISTMVNQLYAPGDKRVDAAFSIFYMGINLGAFFSPLICGALAEKIDYKWGFFAAGIGMIIGIILFQALKNKYITTSTGEPIGIKPTKKTDSELKGRDEALPGTPDANVKQEFTAKRVITWIVIYAVLWLFFLFVVNFNWISTLVFATSLTASGFILSDPTLTKTERDRIIVIYIAAFFVIFFWSAFEQAGASLTLFADQQTDRTIFGWEMPASWFQSFNPIFIVILAPIFATLWGKLGKRGIEPPAPMKQALGLGFLALGFLFIAFGTTGNPAIHVSILWLTGLYFLHTVGELFLSPIGLSMVNKLTPGRFTSLMMGIWFMAIATGNKLAGTMSSLYPDPKSTAPKPVILGITVDNLHTYFMIFVAFAGIAAIILFLLSFKLRKMMHGLR